MAVTNADIQAWTAANPAASHQDIYNAMQQHGVTPDQLAQATGWDANAINTQYAALTQPVEAETFSPYFEGNPERSQFLSNSGFGKLNDYANVVAKHGNLAVLRDAAGGYTGSFVDNDGYAVGNVFNLNSPSPLLKEMASLGVPLSSLQGMNEALTKSGVNISPNQMYQFSNHGVDFNNLASGGRGTSYDWTSDLLAGIKGPTALGDSQQNQAIANYYGLTGTSNNLLSYNKIGFVPEAVSNTGVGGIKSYDINNVLSRVGAGNYSFNPTTNNMAMNGGQRLQSTTPSAGYVQNAFPQYTPDYGNLTQQPATQPQYTPNYANNALMRPVTQNSNITAQNQYQNMGYNNKRSSLWGDW
jgi:hypothetical protein